MVDAPLSVKTVGDAARVLRMPSSPAPVAFLRPPLPSLRGLSLRGSLLVAVFLALGAAVTLAGCAALNQSPCFPASSAAPPDESEGGFSRKTLAWEIDKMAALVDVPDSDAPPTELFLRAQRDMRTEFWADAAKECLSVVRGDTKDGKRLRQFAQYDFALSLFRMRYFEEARRVFQMIAADPKHPRHTEAKDWAERKTCSA